MTGTTTGTTTGTSAFDAAELVARLRSTFASGRRPSISGKPGLRRTPTKWGS
jgi:hypothetical protein